MFNEQDELEDQQIQLVQLQLPVTVIVVTCDPDGVPEQHEELVD